MENSDAIYLLSAALCSFLSLDDNTASCHRRFSQIFMLFLLRKLCVLDNLSYQKPTTHNKNSPNRGVLHSLVVDVCKCRE